MRFVDLFAGMGGFHRALRGLGHECVFASEIDEELRALYGRNFRQSKLILHGDIRLSKTKVPPHDILCAGFPCQPFSKSGYQKGVKDLTRGTLFHEILEILARRSPSYVILENVGNFERHNDGQTWKIVRESLVGLGYQTVLGTTHRATGGHGLISPHHLGFPHNRERFFVVASLNPLAHDPFPARSNDPTSLRDVLQTKRELSQRDTDETRLTTQQVACIDHWNHLLRRIPEGLELPSFPIWGDEIDATYPYVGTTPAQCTSRELRRHIRGNGSRPYDKKELLDLLPRYARPAEFPAWKEQFIRQNREWFASVKRHLPREWTKRLHDFPPSLRKLEWNCKGEERDLWAHVLQFRPSGLRAKRFTTSPALVAMTTTQTPILGPERRFITRIEGLRLQGFSQTHRLPESRASAFAALGNAVHVGVVREIAKRVIPTPDQ